MSVKIWWKWFRGLELSRKWYVWLILLRPIIDNFYELKETSVLASPLYIVGILTPILVLLSSTSSELPRRIPALEDTAFRFWGGLLFFNAITYYFIQLSVVALGDTIKYVTPLIIFAYSRRFIQSKDDLYGILTTFLVSCIFPFSILLYESIFNPIAIEYISSGRGGGSRIRGAYADIMNYAIYLIVFMIIMGYYFLVNIYKGRIAIRIKAWHMVAAFILVFYGLTRIRHVSTWGVFIALTIILLLHNLRNARGALFAILFVFIVSTFFAQEIYSTHIEPLIGKELKVVEGESESNQAFNGRMTRWEKYFEIWQQMPPLNHFFGIVSANFKETVVMIGGGMHSDYVRLLFLTGILGLLFYVIFLLVIFRKWFYLDMPEKFLIAGTISAILLWSITTVPTLYAPLLYVFYPIMSFALLPQNRQK